MTRFIAAQPHDADAPAMPAKQARELIIRGEAPPDLHVHGHLDLSNTSITVLPVGLAARSLDVSGCTMLRALPAGLNVRRLHISSCTTLTMLPEGLRCYEIEAKHTRLQWLPADLQVEYKLDLSDSTALEALPANLKVGSLIVRECTALRALPEGLDVYFLDITGCTRLSAWPQHASVRIGRLNARGCTQLRALPIWLTQLAQLDVSGCVNLTDLPPTLHVSSWIDLAHSGLTWLPASARGAHLRWRGVPIDERIAFQPETITVEEVLDQPNAELRRVLLERMGYERFLQQARATELDRDRDPGGERRLLKVALEGDEDLVCIAVLCPSTGRQYLIRVPPTMRTCRHAAAWIAGFDDPNQYAPLQET